MLNRLSREILKFLIVGLTTVFIDYLFYNIFLYLKFSVEISKGLSFIIGAFFAFIANRIFTFQIKLKNIKQFYKFIIVYLFGLILNVCVNNLILLIIFEYKNKFLIGFLISTFISATSNFLGMKYLVFNQNK